MTAPVPADPTQSQILLKLGEMGERLATISEQLKPITDHETRIRQLEQFRWKIAGLSAAGGIAAGGLSYLIGHVSLH